MTTPNPNERLLRFLQATPEQQAAIERILDGQLAPEVPAVSGGEWPLGPGNQSSANGGQGPVSAEPFITKAEAARRLNRDVRTMTTWMRKGLVPSYKIAHTVAFRWSEVEKQLAATCRVGRPRY